LAAPRYGTNDDMVELVARARERGIRVLLDLVAGHTSIEHPWFRREPAADGPDPDGDRYVWSAGPPARAWALDMPGTPAWVRSPGPRRGWYLKNFYDEQPALNFGRVARADAEPWRDAVDAPGPRRNRQALRDVMAYRLDRGVSGFRVDMAFSLVKDEEAPVVCRRPWRCGASSVNGWTGRTPTRSWAARRRPASCTRTTPSRTCGASRIWWWSSRGASRRP
jgi:maltose alpha-D-glucosyltransferase/alpha-amylase